MPASLVILAAGLGSRFKGGIKQLAPVGAGGEILPEFSVYDALSGGFDKIIFVIRRDISEYFEELISRRFPVNADIRLCFQDNNRLPEGFECPEGRVKPWGTVHAVLSAKDELNGPFLIINADDYYGRSIYGDIHAFLTSSGRKQGEMCMGGFILGNTLSRFGEVKRGICSADSRGMLASVAETYRVSEKGGVITGYRNNIPVTLDSSSIVSMNMWGCGGEIIPMFEDFFGDFLRDASAENRLFDAECELPSAFDSLIKKGDISVRIIPTNEKWYGMTVKEDLPGVSDAFSEMTKKGIYPLPLFSRDG